MKEVKLPALLMGAYRQEGGASSRLARDNDHHGLPKLGCQSFQVVILNDISNRSVSVRSWHRSVSVRS